MRFGECRMLVKKGTSRSTFLVGKYAIKVPVLNSMRLFCHGVIGNLQERQFSAYLEGYVAPVLFSIFGLINVQHRANVDNTEATLAAWINRVNNEPDETLKSCLFHLVEKKTDSIGMINQKIVAVDFG